MVDEGHFARAAEKLYITPPALTQQIRKLEREVGFGLLDRDRHPVVPTPAGAAFLREVRHVLDAAQRASAVAASEARRMQQRFDLGFVGTPLGGRTREVLDAFIAESGVDDMHLVELSLAEQTTAVLSGRVDAGFAWGPVDVAGLRVERALTAPRVVALPTGHVLSRRKTVSIADLRDEVHIQLAHEMVSETWSRWWSVDPRPDGSVVRYGPVIHTIAEFLEQVASGRGVCITSELLQQVNSRSDVVFVPIRDIEPSEVVLCTRTDDDSPMVTTLRRLVRR